MYITCILHVYHMYITCISLVYHMYITCISHVCHMYITCILHVYHVYITCISHVYYTYVLHGHFSTRYGTVRVFRYCSCYGYATHWYYHLSFLTTTILQVHVHIHTSVSVIPISIPPPLNCTFGSSSSIVRSSKDCPIISNASLTLDGKLPG